MAHVEGSGTADTPRLPMPALISRVYPGGEKNRINVPIIAALITNHAARDLKCNEINLVGLKVDDPGLLRHRCGDLPPSRSGFRVYRGLIVSHPIGAEDARSAWQKEAAGDERRLGRCQGQPRTGVYKSEKATKIRGSQNDLPLFAMWPNEEARGGGSGTQTR
jgi:hypothetical protein